MVKIRHAGNSHPRPRNTYSKLIAGQRDKKTAPSRLANADFDSQRHQPQSDGHSMKTKTAHSSGYCRPEHHADCFPKRK